MRERILENAPKAVLGKDYAHLLNVRKDASSRAFPRNSQQNPFVRNLATFLCFPAS